MTLQPKEPLHFEKGTEREGGVLRNKDRRGTDIENISEMKLLSHS